MQNYKSVSVRKINALRGTPAEAVWQRNYYEHIIRDDDDLARIREYIAANPSRWAEDRENPAGEVQGAGGGKGTMPYAARGKPC